MYLIRAAPDRSLVIAELTGRVTSDQALRAVSQTFSLAEAGDVAAIECDLRAMERGPGGLLVVAAAIASRLEPAQRLAFVCTERQAPLVDRLIRFSGQRSALRSFSSPGRAERWLLARQSAAERRHVAAATAPARSEANRPNAA